MGIWMLKVGRSGALMVKKMVGDLLQVMKIW